MVFVVVGAGITGLYTCFNLIQRGVDPHSINVIAEYHPGDQSINYTSPWAGGNFSCISPADPDTLKYDEYTYKNLHRVQKALGGPTCGLDNLPSKEFFDYIPNMTKMNSLASYLKNYRVMSPEDYPDNEVQFAVSYTTWNFNCPLFVQNFKDYLIRQGVSFQRRKLNHVNEAFTAFDDVTAVFNCTGIGAKTFNGAADPDIFPGRGQIVLVKAPHVAENRMRWGKGDKVITYIIPRPNSKGQLVLGGYVQKDNWTADTWDYESQDILQRTTKLMPKILDYDLEVLRSAAGLRPYRKGGIKVDVEKYGESQYLVHTIGMAGYGYQAGLGATKAAVDLFFERSSSKTESKL